MNIESSGSRIKKIRLEKGLTLEEAHKKTKIHMNILEALEGDGLTNLSPIYLKSFLKIYCQFLGVDPKDYITDYKEARKEIRTKEEASVPAKPLEPVSSIKKGAFSGFDFFDLIRKSKRYLVFVLIIIFAWMAVVNLGKFISHRRKATVAQKQAPVNRPEVVKPRARKAVAPKAKAKSRGLPVSAPRKETVSGIRLGIKTRENCWISLKVDGRVVFQRILEKGRFESWQAKDKIELSLGNAGAVELEVNGQLFSNLGRRGQALKNIIITADGLKIGK
ncbi:MAG: DUF4115 domain-containing protein [Candidatus Omnitrophica bacterium]|nr:DUF4115 domain-containing protein [Candidatus Omnitrophota bacterium]